MGELWVFTMVGKTSFTMAGKTSVVVLIWGLGLAVSNIDDGIVPEDWQAPPQATELAAAVGSQYRVQVRRPETVVGDTSGEGEIIDMASATGKYDAGFVCQQHSLESLLGADKWAVDAHLVQIDPILTKSERFGSIVTTWISSPVPAMSTPKPPRSILGHNSQTGAAAMCSFSPAANN